MFCKSRFRQEGPTLSIGLAVCAAFVAFAWPIYPALIAQEVTRGQSRAGDMECISYCSTTQPGTIIMEVRVRLAERPMSATDLRARVQQQGLEVTVYSDGFERGLYATVPAIKPRAQFRVRTTGNRVTPAGPAQSRIPGLERLVITDVATRLEQPARPFHLMQQPTAVAAQSESVLIRLEGLDPGMEYTYRVPRGQTVVTCQAVVCPVDRIPAPPNRARRRTRTTR